ncbi:tRNA lysidine(34) synthetase TilS [Rubritalea marina]|uniref:tRNA lysidine(34) synthetase TilS n=1 Tax=Rubritalea marina TaxID=361055 RepID=UPI00146144D8|nr:tRNA lysidine(34) synthetase TilS [Rubritalea marina]
MEVSFEEFDLAATWLVGVSGGRDSMCLLELMFQAGFQKLIVVHVNHGLRGAEADEDASCVQQRASELGLPCELVHADVRSTMLNQHWGLEKAAREVRHLAFAELFSRHQANGVFLAHHADDQIETALFNLLRGSHGLKAMQSESRILTARGALKIHRPMLKVRRWQITQFMQQRGLAFREDASNAEPITARNRLRNEALPLLESIMGREVVPALIAAVEAQERMDLALEELTPSLDELLDPQERIHLPSFVRLPLASQSALLHAYLKKYSVPDIGRATIDACMALLEPGGSAKCNLPGGAWMRRREQRLFIEFPR